MPLRFALLLGSCVALQDDSGAASSTFVPPKIFEDAAKMIGGQEAEGESGGRAFAFPAMSSSDTPWPMGDNSPLPFHEMQDAETKRNIAKISNPKAALNLFKNPQDTWMYLTMALLPFLEKIAVEQGDVKSVNYQKELKDERIPASREEIDEMKENLEEAQANGGFPIKFSDCDAYKQPPEWWDTQVPPYMQQGQEAPPPWCRTGLASTLYQPYASLFALLQLDESSGRQSTRVEADTMSSPGCLKADSSALGGHGEEGGPACVPLRLLRQDVRESAMRFSHIAASMQALCHVVGQWP